MRVLDFARTGAAVLCESGTDKLRPPPAGTLRWIDIPSPGPQELSLLRERFQFHPLTLENVARFDLRPRLESYPEHTFIVTHGFVAHGDDACMPVALELHSFLGKEYLITIHDDPIASLDALWSRVQADPTLVTRGLDFINYLAIETLLDGNFPILDDIGDALEALEESILHAPDPADMARLFHLKRSLVLMRRVLAPQRDVLALLSRQSDPRISERTAPYFRNAYDQLTRVLESIEASRDLLGNALDVYLSALSNRTNEIMKRLTIMSAIFLPLTFVTGFFGQNFTHLPYESTGLMVAMIVACLSLPTSMLAWFLYKKWV